MEPAATLNRRVVIEGVTPIVESGRYPAKASLGERVRVEADCFTDGHEAVAALLLHRAEGERKAPPPRSLHAPL